MIQLQDIDATDILTWVSFFVVVLFAIDYNWKRRWLYYYGSKIKGPIAFPFIGSLYVLAGGKGVIFDVLLKLSEAYGHLYQVWIGPQLTVVVSKPDHVELVLKKCLAKGEHYKYIKIGLGNAILTAPLEIWKGHRKLINQTLNQTTLNSYLDVFVYHSNALVDRLKANYVNKQVDLWPEFCKTTFRIVCDLDTYMGLDHTTMDQQDLYMNNVDKFLFMIGERFYKPHYQLDFLWNLIGPRKRLKHVTTSLFDYAREIVGTKKQDERNSDLYEISKKKDFLSFLIRMSQEQNWADQDLVDETNGMIMAGYHTTAATECFCMLMLGLHQDVQEKVYQELQLIFGDSDRDATVEDLNKMECLFNFCKETMRLFPVAPAILRNNEEDMDLDGTTIPKGATFLVPINYIHRDPSNWPNPSKFDPDRFLPEEVQKRHRFSYMPFSIPPRNCVGLKFAEMSMKVTLSKILRNFRVYSTQYDSIESIKLEFNIVLAATNGYGVTLVPR